MRKLLTFFMLSLLGVIAYADEVTFTFSDEDYDNQQEVTSVSKGSISIAFDKGTNNNPPKYYTSGTAVRCYGGNHFTVSSSSGAISEIEFTFGSGDGTNTLTPDEGTFESTTSTWTGSAAAVTFTVGGTSGHRRLAVIKVTYGGSESDPTAPTAAVSFSPGAGSVAYGTMVSLSATVDDAQGIKYTLDGSDPTSSTTAAPYNAPIKLTESCTIKAAAFNYGNSKYAWGAVSSASYTVSAPSGTTYTRVTSLSSADVGRKFIIVCESQGAALGEMYSSGNAKYGKSVSLENLDVTNGTAIIVDEEVMPVTLGANESIENQWCFALPAGNEYLAWNSGNTLESVLSGQIWWSVSFDDNGNAIIHHINNSDDSRYLRYNSSSPRFACYTSEQTAVQLYVEGSASNPDAPSAPVISGTTPFDESTTVTITAEQGASIYYTLDGTSPSSSSTLYNGPFTISATTTVKAIAVVNGNSSVVASKEFTLNPTTVNVANIDEFNALAVNTPFVFTGDLVVNYRQGDYLYAQSRDGSKGILLYRPTISSDYPYGIGDVIPGGWTGTRAVYHGAPQANDVTIASTPSETHAEVVVTELLPSGVTMDHFGCYAVIHSATIANNQITSLLNNEQAACYNTFGIGYPGNVSTAPYDVYGIVGYYNNNGQLLPTKFEAATDPSGNLSLLITPELSGVSEQAVTVTITPLGATGSATIRYTLDGSDPATSTTALTYSEPFYLATSGTYTVKAYATDEAGHSVTAERSYEINLPVLEVNANLAEGRYYYMANVSTPRVVFIAKNNVAHATVDYIVQVDGTQTDKGTGLSMPLHLDLQQSGNVVITLYVTDGVSTWDGVFIYRVEEVVPSQQFKLVTDDLELEPGQYLVVGTDPSGNISDRFSLMNMSTGSNYHASEIRLDQLTLPEGFPPERLNYSDLYNAIGTPTVIVIDKDGSQNLYTLYDVRACGYLQPNSSTKNNLVSAGITDDAQATIAIGKDGRAAINFLSTQYSRNNLRYNSGSTPVFSCYSSTSTMPGVLLYRETEAKFARQITIDETNAQDLVNYMWVNGEAVSTNETIVGYANDEIIYMPRTYQTSDLKVANVTITTAGGATITPEVFVPEQDSPYYYGDDIPVYRFIMPDENVTIAVTTVSKYHTLRYTTGNNGEEKLVVYNVGYEGWVTDGWSHDVKEGTAFTFDLYYPEETEYFEFDIDRVIMQGQETGADYDLNRIHTGDTYSQFNGVMPAEDARLVAYFKYKLYNITIRENENGTVTLDNVVSENPGEYQQRKKENVDVHVALNDPELVVSDVIVKKNSNGERIEAWYVASDDCWRFEMPKDNVSVDFTTYNPYHYVTIDPRGCILSGLETPEQRYNREGTTVTFSYTLMEYYVFDYMKLQSRTGSQTYEITDNGDGTYSFVMPNCEVMLTVAAHYAGPYDVEIASLNHCSIEIEDNITEALPGTTVRFHVIPLPNYGYVISSVKLVSYAGDITGVTINDEGDGWYSFVMPERDVRLYATVGFPITLVNDEHATLSCNLSIADQYANVVVTATPESSNYVVKAVNVDYQVHGSSTRHNTYVPNEDGVVTFSMPRAPITVSMEVEQVYTLAEVLEGTDGENYRLSEDLTVVTLVGNHAYATAADNWVRLDVSDTEGLQAGSVLSNVKGTLSGAGQSPALAVETFEAQSDVVDVTGLVQQVDLSTSFEMPAPAQVVEFLGYYFDGKLRGWSNNSGQSLELATDYASPAFEQGKRYKVLVGIELIEPWRQPAPRRIAAQGYDYDFQNLRGQVVNASEVVITDIDTLRMGEQENTYRFNVLGQPVDEDYRGIVIENGTKRLKR